MYKRKYIERASIRCHIFDMLSECSPIQHQNKLLNEVYLSVFQSQQNAQAFRLNWPLKGIALVRQKYFSNTPTENRIDQKEGFQHPDGSLVPPLVFLNIIYYLIG